MRLPWVMKESINQSIPDNAPSEVLSGAEQYMMGKREKDLLLSPKQG